MKRWAISIRIHDTKTGGDSSAVSALFPHHGSTKLKQLRWRKGAVNDAKVQDEERYNMIMMTVKIFMNIHWTWMKIAHRLKA